MREWQVGDPIGLGEDLGVPDIPYMGYLKDRPEDDVSDNFSFDELLDLICSRMCITSRKAIEVKREIGLLLRAKGAYLRDVRFREVGWTEFIITRENRYFRTDDKFIYLDEYDNPRRVFEDAETYHHYENLLNDDEFKNLIRKTGLEFERCSGGYRSTYHMYKDKFELLDGYDLWVHFILDETHSAVYELDLENMALSDDYGVYER